jgi:hypothetical protein
MNFKAIFSEHPASVGETYAEHFVEAMGFSLSLLKAAGACAVHAVLPFAFEKTASRHIERLHRRMVTQRGRATCAEAVDANPRDGEA